MADRPWLTVVMPTFNAEAYLETALTSIADQAGDGRGPVEVLVIDDRSEDNTVARARALADGFTAPTLRIHVERRGEGSARNWVAGTEEGLRRATGRFCCFLHQDDVWLPGRLDRAAAQLEATGSDWWVSSARFIDVDGRALGPWRAPLPAGRPETGRRLCSRLLVQNFFAIAAPIFPTEVAQRIGLRDHLWYTADWDLWLRLARELPLVAYDPQPGVGFRIHGQSQTIRRSLGGGEFRRQLTEVFEAHAPAVGSPAAHRAARLSVEVNATLAALSHRQRPDWRATVRAALRLGPASWGRFWRHSRVHERVAARMRARSRGVL